jgi:GGDEF domain-containing protein
MLETLGMTPFREESPSVSIGVASGLSESHAYEVLATADAAMYQAKRLGGGQFVVAGDLEVSSTSW